MHTFDAVYVFVNVCHQLFEMRSKLYSENVIQKMRPFNIFHVLLLFYMKHKMAPKKINKHSHKLSLCTVQSLTCQDHRFAYKVHVVHVGRVQTHKHMRSHSMMMITIMTIWCVHSNKFSHLNSNTHYFIYQRFLLILLHNLFLFFFFVSSFSFRIEILCDWVQRVPLTIW